MFVLENQFLEFDCMELEHISDASFLDKLLVLPANVGLDWKVIASYKRASLLGLDISDEGKKVL